MTITAQTPRSGPYSGDGSTTGFSYTFLIDAAAELVVVVADVAGVETVQTLTTDYTVSGVGSPSGGTVTFVTAPGATDTVAIRRATVQDQGLDLQNRGAVVPQLMEDAFDEVVKMVQDVQEQISRAILFDVSGNVTDFALPTPEADKVLGWNTGGTALENKTVNSSAFLIVPAGATDNAIVRFDGAGGNAFQNSSVLINDTNDLSGARDISLTRNLTVGNAVTVTAGDMTVTAGDIVVTAGDIDTDVHKLDVTNVRLGIGQTTPLATLHLADVAPTIRFEDIDVSAVINDLTLNGAFMTLDLDTGSNTSAAGFNVDYQGSRLLGVSHLGTVLGVQNSAENRSLKIVATDAIQIPNGTTAQRPSTGEAGDLRFNTTLSVAEIYNGAAWAALSPAGRLIDYQEFTASGTWNKPAAAASGDKVYVQVVGGGGAGGSSSSAGAGGGGGGGAIQLFNDVDDLPASIALVVGAGGATASANGGDTTFGTAGQLEYLEGEGGTGGISSFASAGGEGGDAIRGATGGTNTGSDSNGQKGGQGGDSENTGVNSRGKPSITGGGGGGGTRNNNAIDNAGGPSLYAGGGGIGNGASKDLTNGMFPGGGGGGVDTTYGIAFGDGGDGVVRVWVIRE